MKYIIWQNSMRLVLLHTQPNETSTRNIKNEWHFLPFKIPSSSNIIFLWKIYIVSVYNIKLGLKPLFFHDKNLLYIFLLQRSIIHNGVGQKWFIFGTSLFFIHVLYLYVCAIISSHIHIKHHNGGCILNTYCITALIVNLIIYGVVMSHNWYYILIMF